MADDAQQPHSPEALLKRHFGHDDFRPMQREIVEQALAGRDVFVVMPTGSGKSLCYQLPALVGEGTTVVVSPLIALMLNQVDALQHSGIAATMLNSSVDHAELVERERRALAGEYRLLYMAPERLVGAAGHALLSELNVARFAIDEAHCISEWGHDFRPEYRMLGRLRESFGGRFARTPIMALTATATERVAEDIVAQLGLHQPAIHRAGFERENLHYEVRPKQRMFAQIMDYLREHPSAEGIIYCASRNGVDTLVDKLRAQGESAVGYHAGMESNARAAAQHAFIHGDARVCVATIAFGMGVDKPDVRFVMHADLPRHLEGYYQETGRAGRDGLPADCILFYSGGDRAKVEFFIQQKESAEQQRHARWQLQQVVGFVHASGCRLPPLLAYFGETHPGDCGHCDNCKKPPELVDATEDARKLLSAVYRTGQRFGLSHVINVLRGSEAQRVIDLGHANLSVYGIGKDRPVAHWRQLGEVLVDEGYLGSSPDEYRTVYLTEAARPLLKGELSVAIARPRAAVASRKGKSATRRPARAAVDLDEKDQTLFEALRALRMQLARDAGVPPYVVFGDRALGEMATHRPTNDTEFLAINGVGQAKLERYGNAFLDVIRANAD